MPVTETVADIRGNAVWTYLREDNGAYRTIVLTFDPEWANILTRDQKISALCQITAEVNVAVMQLNHCRLDVGK
jgi:hypothetical protein